MRRILFRCFLCLLHQEGVNVASFPLVLRVKFHTLVLCISSSDSLKQMETLKGKVRIRTNWLIRAELVPVSVGLLLSHPPRLDASLSHAVLPPALNSPQYPFIHLAKNTTQCLRPGFEPGPIRRRAH